MSLLWKASNWCEFHSSTGGNGVSEVCDTRRTGIGLGQRSHVSICDSHLAGLVALDPIGSGEVMLVVCIFNALDQLAGKLLLGDGFAFTCASAPHVLVECPADRVCSALSVWSCIAGT